MSSSRSSSRKGSDAFLLSASHKDSQRRAGGASSLPAKLFKLLTGEEDQSTGSLIFAIIVVVIAFFVFWLLGGQREPSSASQEIMDLKARYDYLLSSHKIVMKELDGLQQQAAQPDPNEAELKALQKELDQLEDKFKEVEAGGQRFSEATGGLKTEVQGVKDALAKGEEDRALSEKQVQQAQAQLEALKQEVARLEGLLNATHDGAALQQRLDDVRAEAVRGAVEEALRGLAAQKQELLEEAAAARSTALGELKAAVRDDVLHDMRALLEKTVGDKVVKEMQANKPSLSFSPFGSKPDADQLEHTVKAVLAKIYEQRLGKVDWLLQINGASVEYNSPSFNPCKAGGAWHQVRCQVSMTGAPKPVQLLPSTLLKVDWSSGNWWSDHSGAMLGNCWAMNSTSGYATMRLKRPVAPESFVLQHVPPSISPDQGGSAPHRFRVVGWLAGPQGDKADAEEAAVITQRVLVEGEYQISDLSVGSDELMRQIQHFPVQQQEQAPINRVRLEILSNHGKQEYTCLYHMRLYGTPV